MAKIEQDTKPIDLDAVGEPTRYQRWLWAFYDTRVGRPFDWFFTECRVMWDRLVVLYQVVPVLCRNHYTFDFGYNLPLLEIRLKQLLKVMEADKFHSGAEESAAQIRDTLLAIDKFQNAMDYIPKPPGAKSGFGEREELEDGRMVNVFRSNDIANAWYDQINQMEEENWEKIWDNVKNHSHGWWS